AYERQEWADVDLARFLDSVADQDLTESIQHEIIRVIGAADSLPARKGRIDNGNSNGQGSGIDNGKPSANGAVQAAILTKAAPGESDPVRAGILASIKKTLKIPESELDWSHPLQDYGLDSIIAMQLATTLEKHLKRPVQPRWLIEHPTLNLLMEKLNRDVKDDRAN
ncbi:MAG: acyl carrier protein, partial [Pseudanabaenales cyanobacterium]|nr:acyl carrier protein [Pseudanabaenales cyanobacterium]